MPHLRSLKRLRHQIMTRPAGNLCLHESLMPAYPGMVESWSLVYQRRGRHLRLWLRHDFVCAGIDFFGDDFSCGHEYLFSSLKPLVAYLKQRTGLRPCQMRPLSRELSPSPLDASPDQLAEWRAHWDRFESEFRAGHFFDPHFSSFS